MDACKKSDPGYEIGSILYIKDDEKMVITPVIVSEKSSVQTIMGTHVTYKVSRDGISVEDLPQGASVFDDIEKLQDHIAELMTTIVAGLIEQARARADELETKTKSLQQHQTPDVDCSE